MGNLSKWQMALGVLFLVLVWGSAWPIYKIALSYSPPLLFAGMRSVAGGILFSLVLLPLHRQLRWKHAWRMYAVSRSDEAGRVSSFTFLVPLTSVLIGTIFLHEPFTLSLFIGMSFILLSIYLMNRKASSRIAAAKK